MLAFNLKSPENKIYSRHLLFKPRCKLFCVINQWFKSEFSRYPMLPFEVQGYEFSIKHGLRKKDASLLHKMRFVVIGVSCLALLLLWSLNNTNVSYALLQKIERNRQPLPQLKSGLQGLPLPPSLLEKTKSSTPKSWSWRHFQIQAGDNLSKIFEKNKLNKMQLHQLTRLHKYSGRLLQLSIHQKLHIKSDAQGNIEGLILELDAAHELHIYKADHHFQGEVRQIGSQTDLISREGKVETSFDQAASGLSELMRIRLKEIFQWEIDFNQLQRGDYFKVIYEQYWFEGEVKDSDILAAGFVHRGETYLAIRHTDALGYTDYYTPWGISLHNISLSVPVEFTRISSFFGERQHPILNLFHFHTGIDYAASRGTPVRASGDGVVTFAGYKGGYGNTLILEHNPRLQTLYAHLSDIADNLSPGEMVFQGQIIGYVGQTGTATGPHLHYEVQLDNLPINPLLIHFPLFMPISEKERNNFLKQSQQLLAKLDDGGQLLARISLPPQKEDLAMMPSF